MTSHTGQQIITIHILSNISKSKDNQTMKSGCLIEYNMRNTFLEKPNTKYGRKPNPRPFYKKSKLSLSLDQQFERLKNLFLLYALVEVYQNILKLRCWTLAFTLYKAFLKKIKIGSGTSLPDSFPVWFLKKNISHVLFY